MFPVPSYSYLLPTCSCCAIALAPGAVPAPYANACRWAPPAGGAGANGGGKEREEPRSQRASPFTSEWVYALAGGAHPEARAGADQFFPSHVEIAGAPGGHGPPARKATAPAVGWGANFGPHRSDPSRSLKTQTMAMDSSVFRCRYMMSTDAT